MGVRSFLIKFNSEGEIKKFFKWRKYLAHLVSEHFDKEYEISNYEPILSKGLPEDIKIYKNKDYGDFDLHLVGMKFWAGAVWGLITTYTVGQDTFALMQQVLDAYYSRLWAIEIDLTKYEEAPQILIEDYYENPNSMKAIEIFNELLEKNKDKKIDYNLIIKNNRIELDKDKFMVFKTRKIFELFNIIV
jgi:hypothetical protein